MSFPGPKGPLGVCGCEEDKERIELIKQAKYLILCLNNEELSRFIDEYDKGYITEVQHA